MPDTNVPGAPSWSLVDHAALLRKSCGRRHAITKKPHASSVLICGWSMVLLRLKFIRIARRNFQVDDYLSYGTETLIADNFDIDAYPMTSTRELVNYLVGFSTFSPKIAEVVHDFDDSDASDSDTDVDYDSDAEAQYITIPPESPWWKAPSEASSSSGSISFATLVNDEEDCDDAPSNHSLEEVLQKQQYLVGLFHDELRRMVPEGSYDDNWLAEVDAKLLVEPVEAFKDACRGSMAASTGPTPVELDRKPLPDVPVDFEEDGDIEDEGTDSPGEWEYPCYTHRVDILKAYPGLDPRFVAHMIVNVKENA
ncbi:hypothetical protein HWV62_16316 [Athelia sp. TMB]|nr:hypothetical protein HWV62_16316 [Athelia sp. TMB]